MTHWLLPTLLGVAVLAMPAAAQTAQSVSPERLAFLDGVDLPDGTWLLLTPLAFGGFSAAERPDFRVIRDTAALRAVASDVWVERDEGAKLGLLALSLVFLSPPANGMDEEFARLILPDGTTQSISIFHPALLDGAAPHSNLAGLLALSEPVVDRSGWVDDPAAYDALVREIADNPDVFTPDPLPPPDPMLAYALQSELTFPSLLLRTEDLTQARSAQESLNAEQRFATAFGPPGPRYAPLRVTETDCQPPQIRLAATDSPVLRNDAPLVLSGFSALALRATLWSDATLPDQITADAAKLAPDVQVDAGLDAALAAFLTASLGPVNPADFSLFVDCWQPDLQAVMPVETGTYVTVYEILPRNEPGPTP